MKAVCQKCGYCCAVRGSLTFQSAFGLSDSQVACLLEGGEGFVDATDGGFVRVDVKIADCVVDQLSIVISNVFRALRVNGKPTVAGSSSSNITRATGIVELAGMKAQVDRV